MKARSIRTATLAVLVAVATAFASCRGTGSSKTRDMKVTDALGQSFGFSGRKLAVDLGQAGPVQLRAGAARLDGPYLLLVEEPNRLHAVDRNDLIPEWVYDGLPGDLRYAPSRTELSFLVVSGAELHQVDLRFGHQRGGPVHFDLAPSARPVGTAGTAYMPSWGGSRGEKTLRTLNLVTGLEGWGYRTPGDIRGGIAIGGEAPRQTVYFATDEGGVYGIPATEAAGRAPNPSWMTPTHGAVTADLVVSGGDLFVSSQDGFLYCMDRITGTVRWSAPHETPLEQSAAATKTSVYQARGNEVWCHDRATGAVRWKRTGVVRFVVERDGKAVLEASDGALVAIDAKGRESGRMESGGLTFPTNTEDGALYGVSAEGYLYKLEVGGE
jgi:outer membrane protein assembly factor BamB